MVESVIKIKYVLLVATILVTFMNLFDCIAQNSNASEYILYVGVLALLALLLIFVDKDWILVVFFTIAGILSLMDVPQPNFLSGGVLFLIFAIRLSKSQIFAYILYFVTLLIVIGNHVFEGISPADAINVILAYIVVYVVDYLLQEKS